MKTMGEFNKNVFCEKQNHLNSLKNIAFFQTLFRSFFAVILFHYLS